MFVTTESPRTRIPMWRAAMTSCTVDIPTRSPPIARMKRISAGVSNCGPSHATYTPSPMSSPSRSAAARARARSSGSYASLMSGKRVPSDSSFGPTSAEVPCRLTWSEMMTSWPGRKSTLIPPAAFVTTSERIPSAPSTRTPKTTSISADSLVQMRPAAHHCHRRPHRASRARALPHAPRPWTPASPGSRSTGPRRSRRARRRVHRDRSRGRRRPAALAPSLADPHDRGFEAHVEPSATRRS